MATFILDLLFSGIEHFFTSVIILRDFGFHNREWLVHSSDTWAMGREAVQFAMVDYLPQLIDFPTGVLYRTGNRFHILDLILTSVAPLYLKYFSIVAPSVYCVITSPINFTQQNRLTSRHILSLQFSDSLASYL